MRRWRRFNRHDDDGCKHRDEHDELDADEHVDDAQAQVQTGLLGRARRVRGARVRHTALIPGVRSSPARRRS
jgi:hypothetical protein